MNIKKRLLPINRTVGRGGSAIDMVVIHVTEGSASSVRSWFASPAAQVSAHYMVCVDGTIDQFVAEDDTAWHAGRVDHPVAPLVLARPHVNPNAYSIGIEHEGTGKAPLTGPQRDASVALIRDICARHAIPIDRTHIVGHHEVYSLKTCPGAIDVNALVLLAAGADSGVDSPDTPVAAETPDAPLVVWSPYLKDYLVVTSVVSDTEWYFVRASEAVKGGLTRATTSLAAMPRQSAA